MLVALARNFGRGPYSLGKIAQKEGISLPYLERIIARLKNKGLVHSVRGMSGGYILGKTPGKMTVGEVISVLESPLISRSCFLCQRKIDCGTKIVWAKINQNLRQTLNNLTIADLLK